MQRSKSGFFRFSVFVALVALSSVSFAQRGEPAGNHEGRRRPRVAPRQVPFHAVAGTVGFPVLFADKREFIDMAAMTTILASTTVTGLKAPAPAAQLTYGFRKGGIGVVYEMRKQPGLDAATVFQTVMKFGTFKDRQYFKGWVIKSVPDKNLLIAVSGTTPEVCAALIKALGK